jgi:aspartate aminotransferase-like enzyme
MGSVNNNDIIAVIAAIESALYASEFHFEMGIGLKTALKILNN